MQLATELYVPVPQTSQWQSRLDSCGNTYWYNTVDGTTTLNAPPDISNNPNREVWTPREQRATLHSATPQYFVQQNSPQAQVLAESSSPVVPIHTENHTHWIEERDAKGNVIYFNTVTAERHLADPADWILKEFRQGYELYVNTYTKDYFWKPQERKCGSKKVSRHYPSYTEKEERRRKKNQASLVSTTTACAPRVSYPGSRVRSVRHASLPDFSSGEEADDERGDLGLSIDGRNDKNSWFSSGSAQFLLSFLLSEPESGVPPSDEELGGCYVGEEFLHGLEDDNEYFHGLPFKERMQWLSSQMLSLSSDASEKARGVATYLFRVISSKSGCSVRRSGRSRINSAPESPLEATFSGNNYKQKPKRSNSTDNSYKQELNHGWVDSPKLSSVPFLTSHGNDSDPGSLSAHSESSFVVPPPELAEEGKLKSPSGKDLPEYDFESSMDDCNIRRNLQSELISA